MEKLKGLKPEKVFEYFEAICRIPHGSGNTEQLSDWLVDFAEARGLEHYQDELNDVIIIKEASAGYEQSAPVILQGHMDMVCNKADGCTKDMSKEGLDLVVDGDIIYAEGTTLGGDDGIAVAYMLAILDDDTLKHPRVEMVFTVDEETGLYGAEALNVSPLKGRRFINIDSEDEGILTVGCAGGVSGIASLPVTREPAEGNSYRLDLSGFIGGHSGTEIIKGMENAAKSMGRLLYELADRAGARLVRVDAGVADNVIPTSASAVVTAKSGEALTEICDEFQALIGHEYKMDPDAVLTVSEVSGSTSDRGGSMLPMDEASAQRVIAYLIGTPNGVEKMTVGIENLPQTSLSLGVVSTAEDAVEYTFCIRSSVDSECEMLARRLQCMAEALGGSLRREGPYPGWEYAQESPLRDLVCEVYHDQTGKDMVIEAIHAGLECGYFAGKMPGLDCVSIGPDLRDVHTPAEKMHIGSVQRTWDLITEVLARMK
ncbi:MAG: aminoacyl-histidine dipeptidase [Firmicutes bacterium]|nr:aminoacyl-histidine dipeptidase [Bacillota bacterium]